MELWLAKLARTTMEQMSNTHSRKTTNVTFNESIIPLTAQASKLHDVAPAPGRSFQKSCGVMRNTLQLWEVVDANIWEFIPSHLFCLPAGQTNIFECIQDPFITAVTLEYGIRFHQYIVGKTDKPVTDVNVQYADFNGVLCSMPTEVVQFASQPDPKRLMIVDIYTLAQLC
eukprot:711095-Amphidinium_carterae.1